jgi:hypothetical protein
MQSREVEDARAPTPQSAAAEPMHDATEDCAEFDVGPIIEVLRRAQATARFVAEACFWIGVDGASRN